MIHRLRMLLIVAAVIALAILPSGPAVAQPADVVAAAGPAVEAPADVPEDEEQPWTARFLAPTVLALGVVALVGSILVYGVRVRGRYRVTR